MKIKLIALFLISSFISSCQIDKSDNYSLTKSEKAISDSLNIDTTIIRDIRKYNKNKIEPFHYSLSKIYADGVETEADPIFLKGLVFQETNDKSYDLVFKLKGSFKQKGYTIFLLENNFGLNKKLDNIAVLKTTDQYQVLKQIQTNGINYDIETDSLIKIIKQFDKKYSLELVGASGDWCEFIIHKPPTDWLALANEVYKICPDVVDQGAGDVEALAEELKRTKSLYFWWD